VTRNSANTAERIEVMLVDSRNFALDASLDLPYGFDAAFAKLLWPLVFVGDCLSFCLSA